MTDESMRNFRSSYYEKVGCYSVEEKKSLNKLLSDNIRNHSKLKQFCLTYTVPQTQRGLLWNIILGVLPLHKNSTEYILVQRAQTYQDLLRAVTILKCIDTSSPKHCIFYTMWLLENNRLLHPETASQDSGTSEENNHFVDIVKVLLQIFDNDVELYWITKEFYACTREIQAEYEKLKELTQMLLKREDIALHNHLEKLDVFSGKSSGGSGNNRNILSKWFATCFAGVLSESALVRVWDKICGGSRKIVIFLFLELVKTFRESIMSCNTQKDLKMVIKQAKDQDAAAIVNKAIKTWQSNKQHSEITVH